MKILGITDQPIDPPASGGGERVRALYERLAKRHSVEILNLVGVREVKGVRTVANGLRLRKVAAYQRTIAFHLEKRRFAPAFMAHYLHAALAPLYASLLRRGGWDVIAADGIALGPILRSAPRDTPLVYSSHNVDSEYFAAEIDRFPLRGAITRSLRAIERRMLARVDRVIAVSDRDRALFLSLYDAPPSKFVVAPNGFDEDRFRPIGPEAKRSLRRSMGLAPDERIILFAGSRVNHNEAAVRLLLERVVPRLTEGTRLLIAGSVGDAFPFASGKRVIVTGSVPDVLPYFHAADVAANPVETGGGTNIKLLQYLATGLPVVSTAFGVRGLDALARFVQVAEPDGLAAALAAPPRAPRASDIAPALADWSWGASAKKVEACYEELVASKRAARARPAR
ncbi:MAG: glycosyltransferase family 4 protein [bacterium]